METPGPDHIASMTTLFISDLHLDLSRPAMIKQFEEFVRNEAAEADALYILGDLFEAWIGDDAESEIGQRFADAMQPMRDVDAIRAQVAAQGPWQ